MPNGPQGAPVGPVGGVFDWLRHLFASDQGGPVQYAGGSPTFHEQLPMQPQPGATAPAPAPVANSPLQNFNPRPAPPLAPVSSSAQQANQAASNTRARAQFASTLPAVSGPAVNTNHPALRPNVNAGYTQIASNPLGGVAAGRNAAAVLATEIPAGHLGLTQQLGGGNPGLPDVHSLEYQDLVSRGLIQQGQ